MKCFNGQFIPKVFVGGDEGVRGMEGQGGPRGEGVDGEEGWV